MPHRLHAPEGSRSHSRRSLAVTAVLLGLWCAVSFVVPFFARDLSFNFFGWPFSFWMGAQGALLVYVLITWVYARTMDRLDREGGAPPEMDDSPPD